jgi:hypothetical protein
MNLVKGIIGLLVLTTLAAGCAHKEKMIATEGGTDKPYETLGWVEVHVSTNPTKPTNWIWHLKRLFTFGAGDASWETRLKRNLIKKAKKHFDADQVINVTYWPDPASKVFPKARIFARGEMIHYKQFPQTIEQAPAAG